MMTIEPASDNKTKSSHTTAVQYRTRYQDSIDNPISFWGNEGRRIEWIKPYTQVKDVSYDAEQFHIRWYADGQLNVAANCLDRHLQQRGEKNALIWEGDDPNESITLTYRQLHQLVCQFANVLKDHGVQRGDTVTLYLPMIPEVAIAMLACTRIGAVHSVVFAGFSAEALAGRISDCQSKIVITADEGLRGGKCIPLKNNVDKALASINKTSVEKVIVVRRTKGEIAWFTARDVDYHQHMQTASFDCPSVPMNAEDPLFILYTSGSTGKPKGVLHTTGGYLVWASYTHEIVFDLREDDIYWCTADAGWITGHSYMLYGPLANGATTLMFEGVPNYPDFRRFWQIVDKHKVSIFYTAPTALRALMREGDQAVLASSRQSLRLLGTVGEPINPEAWSWYFHVVGDSRCPIVDTWWQTETGGILITPIPGAIELKPGSATLPFYGIRPALVDDQGHILEGEAEGNLVILDSWPGQMRSVFGDHTRFIETYFRQFPGMYCTGDGARRDADGYYWITGRVDDVINVSGHRLGTAEIESALVAHHAVAEAAVVGAPHAIKGQGIYAFVSLKVDQTPTEALRKELSVHVRTLIGPIATPDWIQWAPALPKTRSGKIMRRILRKISAREDESLGDISTLADPGVVASLIADRL
jgi:acetyl-CoA synthetase